MRHCLDSRPVAGRAAIECQIARPQTHEPCRWDRGRDDTGFERQLVPPKANSSRRPLRLQQLHLRRTHERRHEYVTGLIEESVWHVALLARALTLSVHAAPPS